MEHDRGTWAQRILAISLALILIFLPVHALISTWGGTAIGPMEVWKAWKELFLIALLPFALAYLHMRPDVARRLSDSWVTRLIFMYVLLNVGYAAISIASHEATAAGLLMNLRFPAIMVLAMIVAACNDDWTRHFKKVVEPFMFGITICLSVIAIAQVTIIPKDFLTMFGYGDNTIAPYMLVDNNPDALRAFATMRGPNTLGAYLILPLILALLALIREPKNLWAGLSVGLGVAAIVMTSSRSAWLGLLAAFFVLVMLSEPAKKFIRGFAWLVVPLVALGFIFLWVAANVPSLRLAVFHSSSGDLSLTEGSLDKHWQATVRGSLDVVDHPLGKGIGTSGPASFYNKDMSPSIPENYFVQIAQEMGVIGLGLFVAICVTVGYKLWQQRYQAWPRVLLASFVGLSVVNLFLHGWSDDPTAMTWWGIAGLYMLGPTDATLKKIARVPKP
jgi:hypothetical protein